MLLRAINTRSIALVILAIILTACVRPFTEEMQESVINEQQQRIEGVAEGQPLGGIDLDSDSVRADQSESVDDELTGESVEDADTSETDTSKSDTGDEIGVDEVNNQVLEDESIVSTDGEVDTPVSDGADSSSSETDQETAVEELGAAPSDSITEESEEDAQESGDGQSSDTNPSSDLPATDQPSTEEVEGILGEPEPITHVVAVGENLYRIGLIYGLSYTKLAEFNDLPDVDQVDVGQTILIPVSELDILGVDDSEEAASQEGETAPEPTAANATEILYTVQAGEYLIQIGLAFGIPWEEIAALNGIVSPDFVYPGQEIIIPGVASDDPVQITHIVEATETLNTIALLYGVSVESLAAANNLSIPYVLFVGQTLIVPGE